MKIRDEYTCPLELVQDMMKGKWKCIIIWRLRLGPTSPSSLKRDISGITEKMLLQHLKELIEFGLVDKKIYGSFPLKTEYYLTDRGRELLKALEIYQKIGIQFIIEAGQEQVLRDRNII